MVLHFGIFWKNSSVFREQNAHICSACLRLKKTSIRPGFHSKISHSLSFRMSSDSAAPERFGSRRKGWKPRVHKLFSSSTQNFESVVQRGAAEEDEGQSAVTIKILTTRLGAEGHWWESKAGWCMGLNIFSFLLSQICCGKFHPRIFPHLWACDTKQSSFQVHGVPGGSEGECAGWKWEGASWNRDSSLWKLLFLHIVSSWIAHEKSCYVTENSL